MRLKTGVQMDPIEKIHIHGDSTFALLLEAQRREHSIFYYTPDKLLMRDGRVFAEGHELRVDDVHGAHYELGAKQTLELKELDMIHLRQDPPFDMAYVTTTHILDHIHPGTLVVNDPASVRNAPEKLFVTEFPDLMPPTLITRSLNDVNAFRAEFGDIIIKPLYGNGGAAVFRVRPDDTNTGSLVELFQTVFREPFVVQQYLADVRKGDKRSHSRGWRTGRCNQSGAGSKRDAVEHACWGAPRGFRANLSRARNLRGNRPRAQAPRPHLRGHRRNRGLPDGNQCYLAHWHSRGQPFRRTRHRSLDLGCSGKEGLFYESSLIVLDFVKYGDNIHLVY